MIRAMVPRGRIEPSGSARQATRDRLSLRKSFGYGRTEALLVPEAGSDHRHCDFQSHALAGYLGMSRGRKPKRAGGL